MVGIVRSLMVSLLFVGSASVAFGGNFDCKQHYDKKGTKGTKKCNVTASGTTAADAAAACTAAKSKCEKLPKAWGKLEKVTCEPAGGSGPQTTCTY